MTTSARGLSEDLFIAPSWEKLGGETLEGDIWGIRGRC